MSYVKHIALLMALLTMSMSPLRAQESDDVHPQLDAKFFTDLGVFFPQRDLKITVNGTVPDVDRSIDFDEQLKLEKNDETFALDLGWRFGKKWQLLMQYFESGGNTGAVLTEDVEWKDVVFGTGTGITAGQDFRLIRSFFGYAFDSSDRHDFGVGAGFHWLEISAFIQGQAIINGMPVGDRLESVSAEAPLPNIGAWYMYSITPRWAIRGRFDWLSASVGDYDGRLINAAAGINYQLFEHFGLGLNYNFFELDIDVRKSDWSGELVTRYQGLYVYLSVYW